MAFPELPWKLKGQNLLSAASYLLSIKEAETCKYFYLGDSNE